MTVDPSDELLTLALSTPAGEDLMLDDRDDLGPDELIDARGKLTNLRAACDRANEGIGQLWNDRYGTNSAFRTLDGRVGIHKTGYGSWVATDPHAFAEFLQHPDNYELLVKVVSGRIPVGGMDWSIRDTFLAHKPGRPSLTVTRVDNPKAPKWATEAQPGSITTKESNPR